MQLKNIITGVPVILALASATPMPNIIKLETQFVQPEVETILETREEEHDNRGFVSFINESILANINTTDIFSVISDIAHEVELWYEESKASEISTSVNSSYTIQYDHLMNWNEEKGFNGHLSVGYNGEKELTYFNYVSSDRSEIKVQKVIGGDETTQEVVDGMNVYFNAAELTLSAKQDYYDALMSGVELNQDGFFKCSQYKNWDIKIQLDGMTISIPLMNLSWNYYEQDFDLCEPMISTLSSAAPYELVFGEYVLQNFVSNFEARRLGLAPDVEGVTFN